MAEDKTKESLKDKPPVVEEIPGDKPKPRLKPIIEYRDHKKIVVGYIDVVTGKKSVVKGGKKK